jgi:hypothetical protein
VRKKAAAGGEEDEGRSRTTKPPTPRLAAVEAAEQAQKLRVVGEELAGIEEEAAGEGENQGMTAGINTGGGGSTDGGQKRSIGRKKKASGVMGRPI